MTSAPHTVPAGPADATVDLLVGALSLAAAVAGTDVATMTVWGQERVTGGAPGRRGSAVEADSLQELLDEGPGLTAVCTGVPVDAGDLSAEDRWPRWTRQVLPLGIRSVLAVPLVAGVHLGSLNFYSWVDPPAPRVDVDRAALMAAHVAQVLTTQQYQRHLLVALEGRTVIGQAQGILMERHRLDAGAAFTLLAGYSQHHNVKLRGVAAAVVADAGHPLLLHRLGSSEIADSRARIPSQRGRPGTG